MSLSTVIAKEETFAPARPTTLKMDTSLPVTKPPADSDPDIVYVIVVPLPDVTAWMIVRETVAGERCEPVRVR